MQGSIGDRCCSQPLWLLGPVSSSYWPPWQAAALADHMAVSHQCSWDKLG